MKPPSVPLRKNQLSREGERTDGQQNLMCSTDGKSASRNNVPNSNSLFFKSVPTSRCGCPKSFLERFVQNKIVKTDTEILLDFAYFVIWDVAMNGRIVA